MSGPQMAMGGLMLCSFGTAPMPLTVLPANKAMSPTPDANIMDNKPFVNVTPFAMCVTPSNPAVAAALGAPMPCTPMTAAPWTPGNPKVLIGNMPTLDQACTLMCSYGGVITITYGGQVPVMT